MSQKDTVHSLQIYVFFMLKNFTLNDILRNSPFDFLCNRGYLFNKNKVLVTYCL